jgi:hypothetical protein
MNRPKDGEAIFVVGSRGAGKTEWVMQQTHSATRLLVWDSLQQWSKRGLVQPVWTIDQLKEAVVADMRHPGRFRIGYAGPISITLRGKDPTKATRVSLFDPFCRIAWAWLRRRKGSSLVIEELADVTQPGKAPDAWGEIVRKSRHEAGSRVFALTQRPAESDKTIAGNCDVLHCGRLSNPNDRKSLATYLDVPVSDVGSLQSLQWIERDMRTHRLARGMVKFS